jgi:hypothetical protein
MPDQGDPIWGAEERFAEAVELGRPSRAPADDPDLARDLEIAGMLRALGPGFSPGADAKARMRARVMGALAVDGPPSDGGGRTVGRPQEDEAAPTEQLPVVTPAPVEDAAPTPLRAVPTAATSAPTEALDGAALGAAAAGEAGTAVLAEPDLTRAVRPRRRRRHALPSRPAARPAAPSLARRVMAVGMAAAVAVLAIAGGSIFASRDAVPGDALYGIKRAAEAAGGIFGGDASRGQHDLDLAATRLDEIERMARDGVTDPAVYTAAFAEFDDATRGGTRGTLAGADPSRSAGDVADWATQQTARLAELRASLPAATQADADDASRLLDRVHRRAVALSARSGCAQVTSGATDDLGPLPAEGPCTTARQATTGGSAPTDRARTAAPAGQQTGQATVPSGQQSEEGGSDVAPDVQSGSSGARQGAAPATTPSSAPSSQDGDNVNDPLLPLPITLPPLVPNKQGGGLLG